MAKVDPIMVSEATAAKMLELSPQMFRDLTRTGVLPKGREIVPGLMRWDVELLRSIARGERVEGMGDVDWRA